MAKTKKQVEKSKDAKKDPLSYSYRGDEQITIQANAFVFFRDAIERVAQLAQMEEEKIPAQFIYEDKEGKEVKKEDVTPIQILSGEIRRIVDPKKTMTETPSTLFYKPFAPIVFQTQELWYNIHGQNVEKGLATHIDTLKKEYEESQKKGKFKIEE